MSKEPSIKMGTKNGAIVCGVIGAVLAVLLLAIGFWKTLFIAAFAGIGALIGGVGHKKEAVREVVNRRFPSKDQPIRSEQLHEAAEKVLNKEEEKPAEEQDE